jgi:hypothetical protein
MRDARRWPDIVEEFVTGERPIARSNRMLAVLLVVGPELGVTGTFAVPYH